VVTGVTARPGVPTRFGNVAREQTVRIVAEMVANVIMVEVAVDDVVAVGDPVCLLESMKMEIPVLTELPGVVSAIKVTPGDVVQEGDVLVELIAAR
jgi:acetyl-CoA carboxylase biotin carboxyl carrier protein